MPMAFSVYCLFMYFSNIRYVLRLLISICSNISLVSSSGKRWQKAFYSYHSEKHKQFKKPEFVCVG